MPKISIIVPVYNVADYLRRCLDSCVYQTLADIEVVVVNDHSPNPLDEEILREYEMDYPNKVRVIRHEKNLGLGEARNTAIRNAKGEYLLFCDSDDFLDFTACEKMYHCAMKDGADLVVCDFYYMRDGVLGVRHVNDGIEIVERSYRPCVLNKTTVWVIMLKKSIIVDNNLFSPFRFGEDNITVLWYLAAQKISKVDEPLYYYVYRKSSLIGSMTEKSAEDMAKVYYEILQYDYYRELDNISKTALCFLIFRRFFGYWIDHLMKQVNTNYDMFFRRLLEIEKTVPDYKTEILKFKNLNWESVRANKILEFANNNLCEQDFNEKFIEFYSGIDQAIIIEALTNLKKELDGKRVVLWAAGSHGITFANALKLAGLNFEVTDLIVKDDSKKQWIELQESTDVVLLTTSEFVIQVKQIIGDIEMIVLQKYLNENLGGSYD